MTIESDNAGISKISKLIDNSSGTVDYSILFSTNPDWKHLSNLGIRRPAKPTYGENVLGFIHKNPARSVELGKILCLGQNDTLVQSDGDLEPGYYILEDGVLAVTHTTRTKNSIGQVLDMPGQVFNVWNNKNGSMKEVGALFGYNARIFYMPSGSFEKMDKFEALLFSRHFLAEMFRNEAELTDRIQEEAFDTLAMKIARFIINNAISEFSRTANPDVVLRITHQELSQLIGTYRETITAAIRAFKKEGYIETDYRLIRVQDIQGLVEVVRRKKLVGLR